jgi:hypothetical protein
MSDEPASVILYPKKITAFLILLGCCIFVVIGIAMINSGEILGYLVAGFFGLCSVVAIVQLLPGSSYLCLDSEGFICCSLFRKHKVAWSDVDEFFVITLKQTGVKVNEMVGYNFAASYDKSKLPRMLSAWVGKCEGGLPDSYGMKAEELAALMNSFLMNR